jgi:amino acid adenylation domain-containing protein
MTTAELLTHLRNLDVALFGDNGQLILRGPKGALTADLRAELRERKAEILDLLKNTAGGRTPLDSSLRCVSREKNLPLSFAQQRLWFLDQLEPGSAVYNVPGALRIKGSLNAEVLERCFNEIVRRHEALRTTFSTVEEDPVQVIAASANVSLPVIDLSRFSETEREDEARRLAREEADKPFDLRQGPLFRTALIGLGKYDHVLLLTLHHIVSDGWSMGVLYRELSALYQAFANEEPSPLADLPIQYADFAVWQRDWLRGEVLENQLSYWKKQLGGIPAVLNFPTDRPRPARQSYRGARQSIELSSELTQRLKTLSRKEGVTLYMTLLAAFQTLLHRYTGQDDIVVGSPIANRNRIEIEGLIGFFVNTLVLRTDHSGNPAFREVLRRVRETALEAYAHQDLPFEKLVEELRPDRDLSRSPLFQAMFVFQNAPVGELNCKGLNVSPMRMAGETTKFDLTLSVNEGAPGLRAGLQYRTDLFDDATITRFLGHFKMLLEGIVANPEQRISDLPILNEAERHQLLVEWNETKRDYPKDKCIHELFEEQVKRTPETVAVAFEDQQLTYRELNSQANQLAHYLKKLGVGPEALVGICVERSLEMIVGLLGILKAGGAYVPLDPGYPKERLGFMLEDARVGVLLTQQGVVAELPGHQARVIYLDGDWGEIAQESEENPNSEITGENLAYVIYTSGSTGIPKGVMILHRGLVNYLSWATLAYAVAAGQGAPVHSSIGFDLTITSLFTPLLAGRRVELLAEDGDVEALSSRLRKESDYSLIKITPAHLELVGQELPADKLAHRTRTLVIGGEALTFEKLGLWSAHVPEIRLINEYGPTETVVGCCFYEVAPGNLRSGPVPIGRPIGNTQIYILGTYFAPVPIGVIGEIHIGGDGLARGYINRTEATKEKFIANPFSRDPDSRLYKTGDLGRYLPDGNIEFLGRIDNQVKVRGYRIELGEIEVVLGQHPMVQSSVVVVREDTPGDKRLVAYAVSQQGESFDAAEIRKYLKQKLPEYMIPSAFVLLDELPLTPNGKVDRKALPAPDQDRPELGNIYQAPRTPVEEALASIWCELLKVDKVGIHDNFFELGGHSLLATQAVSRMRDALRKTIPLRNLFEAPTVSALALLIEKSNESQEAVHAPAIVRASRESYRVKLEK